MKKLDKYNEKHIKAIEDYIIKNLKNMPLHVKEKIKNIMYNEIKVKQ